MNCKPKDPLHHFLARAEQQGPPPSLLERLKQKNNIPLGFLKPKHGVPMNNLSDLILQKSQVLRRDEK